MVSPNAYPFDAEPRTPSPPRRDPAARGIARAGRRNPPTRLGCHAIEGCRAIRAARARRRPDHPRAVRSRRRYVRRGRSRVGFGAPRELLTLLVERPRLVEPALGRTGFREHASRLRTPPKPARRVAQRRDARARDDRPWGGPERAQYAEPGAPHIFLGRFPASAASSAARSAASAAAVAACGPNARPTPSPRPSPGRRGRLPPPASRGSIQLIERGLQLPMLGDRAPAALDQPAHRPIPVGAVPSRTAQDVEPVLRLPRSPTSIRAVTKSDAARIPSA